MSNDKVDDLPPVVKVVCFLVVLTVVMVSTCTGDDGDDTTALEPAATEQPTEEADEAPNLDRADAELRALDRALGGIGYRRVKWDGEEVDVITSLYPKASNVGFALNLCFTAAAEVDGDYIVSVDASNGATLAFSVDGICRRLEP